MVKPSFRLKSRKLKYFETYHIIVLGHSVHNLPPDEKSEGEVLLSIRAIIIMSKGGVPYFQDRFDDFEFNSTLLAGITSAISVYMDTFTSDLKEGFESMKNAGLTISSHKSEISTIIIVSEIDLSLEVINQIRKSQILLDRKYRMKLEGHAKTSGFMDPIVVYEKFETAGFKIGFKKIMTIHEDSLQQFMDDRQVDPTLRYHLNSIKELINSQDPNPTSISLEELKAHFEKRNMQFKDIMKLLVMGYEKRVVRHRLPIEP